jgi:hypothetical protein
MATRVGFVTGIESVWQHHLVAVKQGLHRLSGGPTPDVYGLPRFLGEELAYIRTGQVIDRGEFDRVFCELNASDEQLGYLDALVAAQPPPVVVVPGPPEILFRELTHERLVTVRRILRAADHVLAYSPELARFYNGLIGDTRVRVAPWPFDYAAVVALGDARRPHDEYVGAAFRRPDDSVVRVVLNVPLRFVGVTQNYPFVLKAALLDALDGLAAADRTRVHFHSFVYDDEDRRAFERTRFADNLHVVLEARRSYGSFVRFLSTCDAVVNITAGSVLGRITFLAAALGKPGLFSDNSTLNAELYPTALVPLLQPAQLREALSGLLSGLVEGTVPATYLPDEAAARRIGDFAANAAVFRRLMAAS